jgi:Ca2+-binding RTX toxin-like protein
MFVDTWDGGVNVYDKAVQGSQSFTFTFGFQGFRGAKSDGTWTLQVELNDPNTKFALRDFALDLYGAAPSNDDVHTYTDEFFAMAQVAGEGGRRTLRDTDGGIDWINAAAVRGNVEVSLVEDAKTMFGGKDAFTIARGSRIENAVTGDGNDRLIGNALDNKLYGMRGDDWLNGGAGDDTLYGGQGKDVFAFDTADRSGYDRILDWSTGDRIATSKQLRGADANGLLTLGSNALLLLDGTSRGDTAELVDQGGAVLRAMGKTDGYWWYDFVSNGDADFVDGRVRELALGQMPGANDAGAYDPGIAGPASMAAPTMENAAFFLYNTMGDFMTSGVQLTA